MAIGVSSSCLYPLSPFESLEILGNLGIRTSEVFINSPSEMTSEYAKRLNSLKNEYGIDILSLHPFTSFAETVMLFSEYKQRFTDTLEYYKTIFETTAMIGAKITVIHGSRLPRKISDDEYFERFSMLVSEGKRFGITVAQENVHNHFSQNPEFMKKMRKQLGSDFSMVMDIKQARRAGFDPMEFASEFAKEIVHIHLSDHDEMHDCMPPMTGNFDFKKLFGIMKNADYKGGYVIELYRHNFDSPDDLLAAKMRLDAIEK